MTLEDFDPEKPIGSVILLVPDTGILFDEFAEGLRAAYGKLPIAGIPRITRPRRRQGPSSGFSVVDPGRNWLRVTSGGGNDDDGPAEETSAGRLDRVLKNAARQSDARGNEQEALVAELAQAAQLRLDLTDGKDNAAGADTR